MPTFISLLRGINVGGHKKILMTDLTKLYENLSFSHVQTYIQSGNVVFDYAKDKSNLAIAELIENAIEAKYKFQVPVLIRQANDLISTINNNPFVNQAGIDPKQVAVVFLDKQPTDENLLKLEALDYPPDKFIVDGLNIYLHCPAGFGNSKLPNNLFENKLKVRATSRNLRTINKLIEMSS